MRLLAAIAGHSCSVYPYRGIFPLASFPCGRNAGSYFGACPLCKHMAIEDKFNINLNQNLWGLIIAFTGLGIAERFGLKWLFWLSLFVSLGMSAFVLFAFGFYTVNYCARKRMHIRLVTSHKKEA